MEEYLRATGVFSLSLLAVSASFMFDPASLATAVFLIPLTVVMGFVAFISSESFERASLAAIPTLMFLFIDPVVGAAAVLLAVGLPLVSIFTGGDSFRDFFGAVSMPLLVSGLVLGGGAYVALDGSQSLEQRAVNLTSEKISSQTTRIIQESGFRDRFKQGQVEVARATSRASIGLTGAYIRNASLDAEARAKVAQALGKAQEEVPDEVASRVSESSTDQVDLEPQIEQSMKQVLDGRMPMLAIPLVAGIIYAANPLVGLLVGIWAVLFNRLLG
jgi:hypothetical protein